ncbi:MAG: molybdenum cofactor biosynthesis protein MoaE [Gammaproteobacteria bacterium]|jgi:molybdopterin synthase catalytic subunit|nr:molybdenum cofactor biosynthesis protein MoaE [Gammaproteobacteria bacterium]MBT5644502.1 molybdenum cofactor biosynthesis protein MoaE [Gammaproteobacteria bacterium]MBT5863875.1 molybdenum cofactor biosynthesis protein MoaE [Gammaproteobacteria bacterium]MBT6734078.1 molybdenum cofactor biosynthesis protein MoaE [Gammaproteobacteria bacterium]MBT7237060.1 molybdenum cofactor biosynthesis protein MoaE [Gammaproteobacteria bacterium]|tara:strand:+ start:5378 stop:5836 length:459 start_codon:yes stop_codon:yes gene_type:complete
MKIEIMNEKFDPWEALVDYKKNVLLNDSRIGATSVFVGTVRDFNDNEEVENMELEHYPGMTEKYLEDMVNSAIKKYNIIDGLVIHRVGLLEPTDPIVVVATWSEHRENAFNATRDIMEALKAQAPFWKKESTNNGFRWVKPSVEQEDTANEV